MDQFEQRLRAADPVTDSVPIDRPESDRARTLLEEIMKEDLTDRDPEIDLSGRRLSGPARWIAVAAAAVVVAVGIGVVVNQTDDVDGGVPLALTAAPDGSAAMCLEVTPESLRDQAEVAFEGTVTAVDGAEATLTVDEWFTEGDAAEVTITNSDAEMGALLGGFEMETGSSYLVAAADGNVLSCGLSGPSEPQLAAIFDTAFG